MDRRLVHSLLVSRSHTGSLAQWAMMVLAGVSLGLSACSESDSDTNPTTSNTTSSGSTTDDTKTTDGDDTDTTGSSSGSSDTTSNTPTNSDSTDTDSTDSTTSDTLPNALGEDCKVDDDCESKFCHLLQGTDTGLCSECKDDASCQAAGTGKACVPTFENGSLEPRYWVCGAGALGDTCEAETSCEDALVCAEISVIDMSFKSCSGCQANADCGDSQICNLDGDVVAKKVYLQCAAVDSLENDDTCSPQADGSPDACKGFCVEAKAGGMALTNLGICGVCRPDHAEEDCGAGKTCSEATITITGMTSGSKCI